MADETPFEQEYFQRGGNASISNGILRAKKIEDLQSVASALPNPPNHPPDANNVPAPSAVEVELQMLEPVWFEALCWENKMANDEQIETLLDLKLQQARQLIPVRWMAEKAFKANCQMLEQIYDSLDQVLITLQTKEIDDPSVRIEEYQAQRAIQDWSKTRQPVFEANYQEASRVWYKPEVDPLTTLFTSIRNKFGNLIARYEYECSIRPPLGGSAQSDSCAQLGPMSMEQFNVTDRIEVFDGDLKDPKIMAKFTHWKSRWEALVAEMKALPDFNTVLLFDKLKHVLSRQAFKVVHHHPPTCADSYKAAMRDLSNKFENPMTTATFFMMRGLTQRTWSAKQFEYAKESFNELRHIKDIFEKEKVDIYNFALTCTFLKAMSKEMVAKWDQYKIQVKTDYQLKRATAKKNGDTVPEEWKSGMVENYEQFNAWLRLQSAQLKQAQTARVKGPLRKPIATPLTKPLHVQSKTPSKEQCFLCGPKGSNGPAHYMSRCRRALSMPLKQWKKVCRLRFICYKCTNPEESDHQCDVQCRLCFGKREEINHHIVMCPLNKFRTAALDKE
ncbi:uncharacterized protein LOC131882192 [Tigriopus californicus]|uniref:uncharacterized protein LOC131882192 n=1 Tax=Tigriopus californicus TaxID=6832 RepID=UPI0027DA2866|nr:uncharacterized protein LOC131882192 [Tigriopus californicus]